MIWIAAILGVFLFYRFVECKHKVALFLILGSGAAIGCLSLAGYLYYEYHQAAQKLHWLVVETPQVEILANEVQKLNLVEQVWQSNEQSEEIAQIYPDIPPNEREILKRYLLMTPEPALKEKGISSLAFAFTLKDLLADPNQEGYCSKAKPVELQGLLTQLRVAREEHKRPLPSTVISLSRALLICGNGELHALTLPPERALVAALEEMRQRTQERVHELMNAGNFGSRARFHVCNNRPVPLSSCTFDVSGFQRGHSTPKAFSRADSQAPFTKMESDIIIGGNSCATIVYTGLYGMFSKYEVNNVTGKWQE